MEIRFGYLIGRFVSKSIYMKYRLLLLLFSLHFISCDSRVKKEYYDNGKLKSIVEVRRNARNGTMCEYFPDGSIKSKSEWKNGVKHGKSETFYSNGNIEILSYWVDGKENGISKRFTRNGVLYSTGRFFEDRKGEVTIFYENGKVNEWQLFDGRNHLIYLAKYDSIGNKEYGTLFPIFDSDSDTITLGEEYEIRVGFGLPLRGKLRVLVGVVNTKLQLSDTLAVLESKDNYFEYALRPKETGKNSISFAFEYEPLATDTLNADGIIATHTFFVRDDVKASPKVVTMKSRDSIAKLEGK